MHLHTFSSFYHTQKHPEISVRLGNILKSTLHTFFYYHFSYGKKTQVRLKSEYISYFSSKINTLTYFLKKYHFSIRKNILKSQLVGLGYRLTNKYISNFSSKYICLNTFFFKYSFPIRKDISVCQLLCLGYGP